VHVTRPEFDHTPLGSAGPHLVLLDVREGGEDIQALRARARALTRESGAPHASRSYRYPYALVGWHGDRIGVDIERTDALPPDFGALICTPDERAELAGAADPDAYLASLWCAKEALSKALGDALAYDPARLDAPSRWPERRSGPWRAEALTTVPGHVAWLCWRVGEIR
jgi:phosphopantetheinyl transferase (holo-ACP synthase)